VIVNAEGDEWEIIMYTCRKCGELLKEEGDLCATCAGELSTDSEEEV